MRPTTPEQLQRLNELLHYDAETGLLTWRVDRMFGAYRTAAAGDVAGGLDRSTGYWQINISGFGRMLVHRLCWLLAKGAWPVGVIDHLDGNRGNNALANLRDVPHRMNCENQRRARVDSITGLKGVQFCKQTKKYRSRITVNKQVIRLGYFESAAEAHKAYLTAKRRHHAGCTI